ncbi:MAG: hypothetical protein M1290_01295 [Candidatus Thermoplasmatota archaeon]|jgi:hypothetical protein|nr:hypothetical protein [Candidatus Thermoplasmatota archaeon]MCL5789084.1 hypothetical protein [Candidatus Thermoplasmatota archaeon]
MEPVRIPITQEMHRKRKMVVVVGVVVALISLSVFFALSLDSVATTNVMGVQVHLEYAGNSSGYLGPAVQNYTWNFKTLTPDETFHFHFKLTNHGSAPCVVSIDGIGNGGFKLLSSSPSMPLQIAGGSTQTVVLTLSAPSNGYVGELQIFLSAS